MATWSSSLITDAGLELLEQAVSGSGVTITRAGVGGGTVSISDLKSQTALSTPLTAVPCYIASKKPLEGSSGLEIKLQIRNDSLTESKTFKQVGLFAKAGNGEEVLFAIAQDENGEEVPAETEYPDFLEEFTYVAAFTNTGNIIVKVSPLVFVTRGEMETELAKVMNIAACNSGLLDNPDFLINQRGETSYSDGYTVDRWCVYNGKVDVSSDHITLEAQDAANVASLRQSIENSSRLAGKTVTFSVDWDILNAGSRCCLQLKYNNEWSQQVFFTEVGRNISAVTVQLPAEITTAVEATIMVHTPATAGVVGKAKLYSAKLEIGNVATPFVAPDPETSLARCQRYLLKINAFEAFRAVYVLPGYVDFSIPTPVSMRPGAISIKGDFNIYPFPIASPISGFTAAIQVYGQNQLRIRATKSEHGLTDAVLTVPEGGSLLISAEL